MEPPVYWLNEKNAFFMALCRIIRQADLQAEAGAVWRSKYYHDGRPIRDGFILGIGPNSEGKTLGYKLPYITLWDACYFAKELPVSIEGTCTTTETTLDFLNSFFP